MTTAKKYPSNYEAKNCVTINSIKRCLGAYGIKPRHTRNNSYSSFELDDWAATCAESLVKVVANGDFGFATEIAKTVEKYGRISEKQAYWIARTAWEQELPIVFDNVTTDPNNCFGDAELILESMNDED